MHMRRLASLLALALLASCSSGDADDPTASTGAPDSSAPEPSATQSSRPSDSAASSDGALVQHQIPEIDASISVPEDWIVLTVDDVDGTAFDDARQRYPDAAPTLDDAEAQMRDGEAKFFAFDPESPATDIGFIPNLNVVYVPGTPPPAEQIAQDIAGAIEQEANVIGEVEAGTAEVSAGRVALVTFVLAPAAPDAPEAWVTQFGYPRETDGFILTLSAPHEMLEEYGDTWGEIADSVDY